MRTLVLRTAALLALVSLAACGGRAQAKVAPPVPVITAKAVRKDVPVQVRAIGTVEAYQTVAVKAQVSGVVAAVHFREGSDVRAGDRLFTIDPRPYEAALHQAESTLARDQAQAENAGIQARRGEQLLAQGILPQDQYDQARATADAGAAAVRADQAAVENAGLQLAYCTIAAPIGGRTGSLLVHEGNVVKGVDGASLVVINRMVPAYVSFAVPEKRLAEVKAAMAAGRLEVEALLPGDEAAPARGQLSFVDNAVDRTTGTIRLKATFANAERRLWPGQFVTALLTLSVERGAVVVPAQAVQTGQSGTFVFVVKPDQTVEARPVVVEEAGGDERVVRQGLEGGESVVTDGQIRLVPGAKVDLRGAAS